MIQIGAEAVAVDHGLAIIQSITNRNDPTCTDVNCNLYADSSIYIASALDASAHIFFNRRGGNIKDLDSRHI